MARRTMYDVEDVRRGHPPEVLAELATTGGKFAVVFGEEVSEADSNAFLLWHFKKGANVTVFRAAEKKDELQFMDPGAPYGRLNVPLLSTEAARQFDDITSVNMTERNFFVHNYGADEVTRVQRFGIGC